VKNLENYKQDFIKNFLRHFDPHNYIFESGVLNTADIFLEQTILDTDIRDIVYSWMKDVIFKPKTKEIAFITNFLCSMAHMQKENVSKDGVALVEYIVMWLDKYLWSDITEYDEVSEAVIRIYENWEYWKAIPILKRIRFNSKFLDNWRLAVINDLIKIAKEELGSDYDEKLFNMEEKTTMDQKNVTALNCNIRADFGITIQVRDNIDHCIRTLQKILSGVELKVCLSGNIHSGIAEHIQIQNNKWNITFDNLSTILITTDFREIVDPYVSKKESYFDPKFPCCVPENTITHSVLDKAIVMALMKTILYFDIVRNEYGEKAIYFDPSIISDTHIKFESNDDIEITICTNCLFATVTSLFQITDLS
jgi:hypothetical protein